MASTSLSYRYTHSRAYITGTHIYTLYRAYITGTQSHLCCVQGLYTGTHIYTLYRAYITGTQSHLCCVQGLYTGTHIYTLYRAYIAGTQPHWLSIRAGHHSHNWALGTIWDWSPAACGRIPARRDTGDPGVRPARWLEPGTTWVASLSCYHRLTFSSPEI